MKKSVPLFIFLSVVLSAGYLAEVFQLPITVKQRMLKGNTYKNGCPVSMRDLRYLRIRHKNFKGGESWGEMIVHREVADEVVKIFKALYEADYPIRRMRLVSDYKGSDWQSIEDDNTAAFNCRRATGSKHYSKHAYGRAIDLNPLENPYISSRGHISHRASLRYRKRSHLNDTYEERAVLLPGDKAVKIFKQYGWKWGGEFRGIKDYQHFSK